MHVSTRALAGLAAAAAVVLALVLAPLGSASGAASGPAEYTDPAGDAKSAPDIAKVTVSLDPGSGGLTLSVDLAADDALAGDGGVFVFLDTDRNSATGDSTGSEYLLATFAAGAGMLKWDGKDMVAFNHQPMVVSRTARNVRITVCSCDIGTQTFNFAVVGLRGNDIDVAPDTGGTFPAPEHPVTIQSFLYSPKPLIPKAGKRFTLKPLGIRLAETNEVVALDSISCVAKLGAKTLKENGAGGCSWLIPKKTRGKKLTVSVNVSYQGQTQTFSQTFRIT
jgi:hypothetical protein